VTSITELGVGVVFLNWGWRNVSFPKRLEMEKKVLIAKTNVGKRKVLVEVLSRVEAVKFEKAGEIIGWRGENDPM